MGKPQNLFSWTPWDEASPLSGHGDVAHVEWLSVGNPTDKGGFWVAKADGFFWVHDGIRKIAVAVENRIYRFYHRGIDKRLEYLTRHYLGGGVVPVPPGAYCINVGANVGEVALALADREACVLAIEPDPYVLPALEANADAFGPYIAVFPGAAWKVDGVLPMYLNTDSADTSAFNETSAEFQARAAKIDTIVEGLDIPRVHLIVGDAEGAEPEVLEGASETLKITDYVSIRASAERNGESTQEACEKILTCAGFDIIYKEEEKFRTLIGKNRLV